MSRKFNPNFRAARGRFAGNLFGGIVAATHVSIIAISLVSNTAVAESSLPAAGDDPLAWLERPVDCSITDAAVNSRYGALLSGAAKNSLLSEEFKFVSSETCSGKRFASCSFSWCKGDAKRAAHDIEGKVNEFAKAQAEVKTRGWELDSEADEEDADDLAAESAEVDSPAGNLVAAAAQDSSSRAALRTSLESDFEAPVFVLGKNSIPTLPGGKPVKGIKRVSGSFMPVAYEVAEKRFEISVAPQIEQPVEPAKVELAKAEAPKIEAPVNEIVSQPAPISEPAKLVAPAAKEAVAPRVVSLVDAGELALRASAERELLDLEKKARDRDVVRISTRVADEDKKKIAWKVVEVPGASLRASIGRAKSAESTDIKGANTEEYSRTIVPGIGRAPVNNVLAAQKVQADSLSRFNIAAPVAQRFRHADPASPSAPPITEMTNLPLQQGLGAGGAAQGKIDLGIPVPVAEGYVSPLQKMKALRAQTLGR